MAGAPSSPRPNPEGSAVSALEIERLVQELVVAIDRRIEDLTSRPDTTTLPRQLAAGCLQRCCSALGAMRRLRDEFPDMNGVLIRNLWEAVIVGLDLLTGPDALQRLGGDMQANQRKLADANPELADIRRVIAARGVDEDRFIVKDAAERVAQAVGGSDDAGYAMLYRGESTFGGHGLGLAMPYVDLTREPWRVVPKPGPINVADANAQVGIGALFASLLAQHVFEAFGIGADPIRVIHDRLAAALNAEP